MVKRARKKNGYALVVDVMIIATGIAVAVFLSKVGFIDSIISLFKEYYILAAFFTGIFFTSAFTIAPASIALIHLAEKFPLPSLALWGGLGAMCGDLILFLFIRDRFAEDLKRVIKPSRMKHILGSMHFGFMKWLSPVLGALIIASPLPDEFGILLLGMSKTRVVLLLPIAFIMNVIGIYLIVAFSQFL